MKKLLLSLALAVGAVSLSAQGTASVRSLNGGVLLDPMKSAMTTAGAVSVSAPESGSWMDFCMCYSPYSFIGPSNGIKNIGGAMQINASTVKQFDGCRITSVLVANGATKSAAQVKIPVKVFCSRSLSGTPLSSAEGTMTLSADGNYTEYVLDEPVALKTGSPVWVGFIATISTSNDTPVAMDGTVHANLPGGYLGVGDSENGMTWNNYASSYGFVCVKARIEGDNLPENRAEIVEMSAPSSIEVGEPFDVDVLVSNMSASPLKSLELEVSVGNEEAKVMTYTLEEPVDEYNGLSVISVALTGNTEGVSVPVKVKVKSVNGNPNEATSNIEKSASVLALAAGTGFEKNVVVEEGTGTWCGWCPRGIVGMEAMREKYKDGSFIGIAVHSGNDPMVTSSYASISSLISSYPMAVVNRHPGGVQPTFEELEAAYLELRKEPAVGKVEIVNVTEEEKQTLIETRVTFALDIEKANYRLAFVAIEDNVGPYPQTNYYAGGSAGKMGGWESKGSLVSTIYNDVARYINNYRGLMSSVPATIERDKAYTYTGSVNNTTITNRANAHYAVLLINYTTGIIENAVSVPGPTAVSIDSVEADEVGECPVHYFNLQGVEVADPSHGQLLIKVQGKKIEKIIY